MKIIASFFIVVFFASCTTSDVSDAVSSGIDKTHLQSRSTINHAVFIDDLSESVSFNSSTNTYEIYIPVAFEFKPYGSSTWVSYSSRKGVSIKCACAQFGGGGCNPWVSATDPHNDFGCEDPCTSGCNMTVLIYNPDNNSVLASYSNGGDFRAN